MKKLAIVLALLFTTSAWATTPVNKVIDTVQATGGTVLSIPTVGAAIPSDTSTTTESNKTLTTPTINGASMSGTVTGTPTFSGALSLTGGPALSGAGTITDAFHLIDSADSTKILVFSLSGMTTGHTLTISTSQSTTQSLALPNVSSGDSIATLNATQIFGSGSTWNGQPIGPTYGGASYVVNNSVASPQSVSATGITLSTPGFFNVVYIAGASSGTTIVTATPSITACTSAGQQLQVVSESATNLITLQNNADLSGSAVLLNGPWTSGENSSTPYVLSLQCDTALKWVEMSRNN